MSIESPDILKDIKKYVHVPIPNELHESMKKKLQEKGISISFFVRTAITKHLEKLV